MWLNAASKPKDVKSHKPKGEPCPQISWKCADLSVGVTIAVVVRVVRVVWVVWVAAVVILNAKIPKCANAIAQTLAKCTPQWHCATISIVSHTVGCRCFCCCCCCRCCLSARHWAAVAAAAGAAAKNNNNKRQRCNFSYALIFLFLYLNGATKQAASWTWLMWTTKIIRNKNKKK